MNRLTCLMIILYFSLFACKTAQKNTGPSLPAQTKNAGATTSPPFPLKVPEEGTRAPGDSELAAIRLKYTETTLFQLQEGHKIYTEGACKNCHGAANIHGYSEAQWEKLIDDMSQRAALNDHQKNAVRNYILAIKATQTK